MADLAAYGKGFDGKWLNTELREILRRADPTAWQVSADGDLRARVGTVVSYLRRQVGTASTADGSVHATTYREQLQQLLTTLERSTPTEATRTRWAAFLRDVHPVYEAARQHLPELAATRAVRPTNITRSLFHVTSAAVAFSTISLAPSKTWLEVIATAFVAAAWGQEVGRRYSPKFNAVLMRVYGPVAHAHERHQVNSATWYATALVVLAFFCSKFGALAGVTVLGLADPIAALVGRRWGTVRLVSGRTLQGSLGFAVTAFAATIACGLIVHSFAWGQLLAISTAAAIIGALVELLSGSIDDNFTIPVAVGAVVTLLGAT